jgi:outer membrane receptor protein involved in Fe transport
MSNSWVARVLGFVLVFSYALCRAGETDDLQSLDFQQLLQIPVVSASNREESLAGAPAKIIVIQGDELIKGGFHNLSEVLDYLPGMTVVRPYSDESFINIWRGIRHDIGSSHILLLDGKELNHLYTADTEILATLPISQVRRIEVVYGPASAVYGANAFVGVINILTKHSTLAQLHQGQLTLGSNHMTLLDDFYAYPTGDGILSLGYRYEESLLDDSFIESFEWTRNRYYSDPALWGDALSVPEYGAFRSATRKHAIDLRFSHQGHQLAFQEFSKASGYGVKYTADSVQNNDQWKETERSFYWQWKDSLSNLLQWQSVLRWRSSGVDSPSDFLEAYTTNDPNTGEPVRVIDYSLWQNKNFSWQLEQSFDWKLTSSWRVNGGIRYERKILSKAYDVTYGPSLPVEQFDWDNYPFPGSATDNSITNNHKRIHERSLYLLSHHQLSTGQALNQALHLGFRYDHQTSYGSNTVLRAGYTASMGHWHIKLLYGEAFEEPPARLLYGGWQGAGSDPSLKPQQGDTFEAVIEHVKPTMSWRLNSYWINYHSVFRSVPGGAINSGRGKVEGTDISVNARLHPYWADEIRITSYLSHLSSEEQPTAQSPWYPVGDAASLMWSNQIRVALDDVWSFTLKHQWFKSRETVITNPIRQLPGYSHYNLNINYQPLDSSLLLSLGIRNLFNTRYFHPGVRSADSGNTPGGFDNNGQWQGSGGFYNSLMPQPGRELWLTLGWQY